MIIGISGKIGSGKDTLGKVIQYLTCTSEEHFKEDIEMGTLESEMQEAPEFSDWQIKKFANKLKECVSIITGIPRKELEKHEVKNKVLGEEWIRYGKANGFFMKNGERIMNNEPCSKEEYEEELKVNWQTAYKLEHTPRSILQLLGTEVCRHIHPNIWINALFSEYRKTTAYKFGYINTSKLDNNLNITAEANLPNLLGKYPDWIITDMRFPNELKAVKDRGGITIRINRNNSMLDSFQLKNRNHSITTAIIHPSETALDNATFDYTIENNGTIEDLIIKMREIMINEKLL